MAQEWVTVTKWHQGVATLSYEKKSGCENCNKSSCGMKALNELDLHSSYELTMVIEPPLLVGQRVLLEMSEERIVKSALLVYILPLFCLFLGVFITYMLYGSGNGSALFGAISGFIVGFFVARHYAKKNYNNLYYQPIILKVE